MYKINEAAAMLGVEKISIYEKLIHNSAELDRHTEKKNGITYISSEGVEVLRRLIYRNEKHLHNSSTPVSEVPSKNAIQEEHTHKPQWVVNKAEIDERVRMFSSAGMENRSSDKTFRKPIKDENTELLLNAQTPELQSEVLLENQEFRTDMALVESLVEEKQLLKNRIGQLRNELIGLDSEIKRKDDALISYHKLMSEDMEWLWDMEHKLLKYVSDESRLQGTSIDSERNGKGFLGKLLNVGHHSKEG